MSITLEGQSIENAEDMIRVLEKLKEVEGKRTKKVEEKDRDIVDMTAKVGKIEEKTSNIDTSVKETLDILVKAFDENFIPTGSDTQLVVSAHNMALKSNDIIEQSITNRDRAKGKTDEAALSRIFDDLFNDGKPHNFDIEEFKKRASDYIKGVLSYAVNTIDSDPQLSRQIVNDVTALQNKFTVGTFRKIIKYGPNKNERFIEQMTGEQDTSSLTIDNDKTRFFFNEKGFRSVQYNDKNIQRSSKYNKSLYTKSFFEDLSELEVDGFIDSLEKGKGVPDLVYTSKLAKEIKKRQPDTTTPTKRPDLLVASKNNRIDYSGLSDYGKDIVKNMRIRTGVGVIETVRTDTTRSINKAETQIGQNKGIVINTNKAPLPPTNIGEQPISVLDSEYKVAALIVDPIVKNLKTIMKDGNNEVIQELKDKMSTIGFIEGSDNETTK